MPLEDVEDCYNEQQMKVRKHGIDGDTVRSDEIILFEVTGNGLREGTTFTMRGGGKSMEIQVVQRLISLRKQQRKAYSYSSNAYYFVFKGVQEKPLPMLFAKNGHGVHSNCYNQYRWKSTFANEKSSEKD